MRPKAKPVIMDACVLIDFIKADRSVLKLIANYMKPLYVLSAVLEEIKEIKSKKELSELALTIIEPELDDILAASSTIGSISFQDKLCLLTAKRNDFICVTNDKELRKQCEKNNVELLWGLQLIAELHRAGGMQSDKFIKFAWEIHRNNPKHINEEIVKSFVEIIENQKKLDDMYI